jgi:O-antigen ligase
LTTRARALIALGAVALPVAFAPLLFRPVYAIALAAAALVVALASRSIVYPVGLAGLPAVAIGLSGGHNPFPPGVIAQFGAAWIVLALVIAVARDDDELSLRVVLSAPVVLTVTLMAWMLVRLGPSLDSTYGSRKLQLFIAQNVIVLVAGIVVARRRNRFELYVFVTVLMAILSSLALVRGLLAGQDANVGGRFAITAADSPIGLGRSAAEGIIVAVFVLLASRAGWLRMLAFGALPLVSVALIASGSRGPVVGLAVGLTLLLLLNVGDVEARRRVGLVIAGVVGAVLLVPQLVPGQDVGRALSIFSGRSQGLSSNGRSELWGQAWQLFSAHPFWGIGTGSFGHFQPIELFPHNIFLETGAELGMVGLLLTVAFVASSFAILVRTWRVARAEDRAHTSLVLALFASALVNACLSSDITSNDGLWLVGGLAIGLARRHDLALGDSFRAVANARLPRRVRPAQPGSEGPTWEPRRSALAIEPPRIVSPAPGALVSGEVQVEVTAPRTGRPVALVRIEWAAAESWEVVGERDERTFDVAVGTSAAVVRSQWLADILAAALGTRAEPSRRRPWAAPPMFPVPWDSSDLPPGEGRIRAVVTDSDGREVASDELPVTIARAAPGQKPTVEPDLIENVRRLRELRTGVAAPQHRAPRLRPVSSATVQGHVELELEDGNVADVQFQAETAEGWRLLPSTGALLDTTAAPEGRVRVRAVAFGQASNVIELVVDNQPPVVRIIDPGAGSVLTGRIVPTVEAVDAATDVGSVLLQRSRDGNTWRPLVHGTWNIEDDDAGDWLLRATAVDESQNLGRSEIVPVVVSRATPEPEPEPEPELESEGEPDLPAAELPTPTSGRPTVYDLQRVVSAEGDQFRRDELEALLFYLRDHANLDGELPAQFDALVAEEFGL